MNPRVPTFKNLRPVSEASSRSKRANRASDTCQEQVLRRHLWHLGLRYRKNVAGLPGKPDIVFSAPRVAVFCDGDFWHGRNWSSLKSKLETGTNADYWSSKIATNRRRDQRVDAELKEAGWRVVRLWEGDVLKHPDRVAAKVYRIVNSRLQQYGDKADND